MRRLNSEPPFRKTHSSKAQAFGGSTLWIETLAGSAVLMLSAAIGLRHLTMAVFERFRGCRDARGFAERFLSLDDVTIAGVVTCGLVAVVLSVDLGTAMWRVLVWPLVHHA
jgi:hypothetical protein